jgi:hypothetical protein
MDSEVVGVHIGCTHLEFSVLGTDTSLTYADVMYFRSVLNTFFESFFMPSHGFINRFLYNELVQLDI